MSEFELPEGHPPFEDPLAFVAPWEERETIPARLFEAMQAYFNRRVRPAPHLLAMLEGDLERALELAPEADVPYLVPLKAMYEYYTDRRGFGSPEHVAAWLADPTGGWVPIGGLSKAAVLAALYNAALPMGYGALEYEAEPATEANAEMWLEGGSAHRLYFDYVKGRRLKVGLERDWLDPSRYDEVYGAGAAARAIAALRRDGPAAPAILLKHHIGLITEAAGADITLNTASNDSGLTESGRALLRALQANAKGASLPRE